MATWIVHFRLAENLLGMIQGLDVPQFVVGSIAPDSGMPDEKWENFTPPPMVTHFQNPQNDMRDCEDLVFYRKYLAPGTLSQNSSDFSFRLGYFFHLVTDNLWGFEIGRPTQQRFAEQFKANKDFIWEVKQDWYGLDFIYLRDHPNCLFQRVFLNCVPSTGGLEFLLPEGVRWSVEHIQQYYQQVGEEIEAIYNRPYIYLSQADMDLFVVKSTQRLYLIYKQLWIIGIDTDNLTTALTFPV